MSKIIFCCLKILMVFTILNLVILYTVHILQLASIQNAGIRLKEGAHINR